MVDLLSSCVARKPWPLASCRTCYQRGSRAATGGRPDRMVQTNLVYQIIDYQRLSAFVGQAGQKKELQAGTPKKSRVWQRPAPRVLATDMDSDASNDKTAAYSSVGSNHRLPNPHLAHVQEHFLYHLGISSSTTDIPSTFNDVKFVCIGGTPNRMEEFACYIARELGLLPNDANDLMSCSPKTERYSLFKVGPVLCASHGIGVASTSVLLHELFKLLHLAGCTDVTLLRIGTCGGVGVEEGTVVISDGAVNGELRRVYTWNVLGKAVERPIVADLDLAHELQACANLGDHFPTIVGTTLCADDFYEGQARLDGALCTFTTEDKKAFMHRLRALGVKNIEMESAGVLALCHAVGIRAAVACVCLVDRLVSELPKNNNDVLAEYQRRPQLLAARFIKSRLGRV